MDNPNRTAREAGLLYVTDEGPGFKRRRQGKGFVYVDERGHVIHAKSVLNRIKSLVIPPAWVDVWICPTPHGHLQVTGRDVRGRKQYRYHEKWMTHRNENKFRRLAKLCKKLPHLRRRISHDLKLKGLPREKVIAAVVKMMLITQARVGNREYAQDNESYGLTTIHNKHVKVKGTKIELSFKGKSGVLHDISVDDPELARIVNHCQELPGQELFAYKNEQGHVVDVTSTHVNDYLRETTGEDFTAKDLRTWGGTCKAVELLAGQACEPDEKKRLKRHVAVIKETATYLRNTVAVCRKYYIHPSVFEFDARGKLQRVWKKLAGRQRAEKVLDLILKGS